MESSTPPRETPPLTSRKAIGNRDWSVWHDYLRQTIQPDHHLISAEQLGSRLTERRVIARLGESHDVDWCAW